MLATPGIATELAEDLAEDLRDELGERYPDVEWLVEVSEVTPAEPSADTLEILEALRRRREEHGWDAAVGLTDLPLRTGRRPVTAHARPEDGVGLISVPALGALRLRRRLRKALIKLVEGLSTDSRLDDVEPLGLTRTRDDGSVRFLSAPAGANLRLLVGMVRANQPSRVIVRLSRALVGALGTGAFAIVSANVWSLAIGAPWPRLLGFGLLSIVGTCFALVLAHGLWQRAHHPAARERVRLFNVATTCTIAIGAISMYLALFALSVLAAGVLIPPDVLEQNIRQEAGIGEYLKLAWLVASLATIGGALGSLVESDLSVRDAAYRNRADEHTESGGGNDD